MAIRALDYGKNSPFSTIFGRPRSLAWPVHAFRITIPATIKSGQRQFNPFERVILGMIDAVGGQDVKVLAEETCIPEDLVRSVVLRLRDSGLIDNDNRIIDRRRRAWEGHEREDVYTTALVFRELVGGEVLPFVQVLDDNNPIKTKDFKADRRLGEASAASKLGPPSTREVIDAIAQMQKRGKAHGKNSLTPTIQQVRIEQEPEEYLLDCRIAIQARDSDFRIADPFGIGFSRVLEGVFDKRLRDDEKLESWLKDWYQNLTSPGPDEREHAVASGPYDTPANGRRYPNLVLALTPSRGATHRSVTDIFAALEWALFYTCEAHSPAIAIRQLSAEAGPGYSQRLVEVAASLGFDVPPLGFRPIARGKFDDFENGKAEMETVLAIALLQAESDDEHPVRRLATTQPNFIVRVRALANDRGERAHGVHVSLARDTELASDPFMREAVSTLLPAVRFDAGTPVTSKDSMADLQLDARASLLGTFGYQSFGMLGPDAQNSLIEAEKFVLLSKDGDDARGFLINLYAALQGVLRSFLGGAAPSGLSERDYKKVAGDRARQVGLGELPQGIGSVNPRRVREALQGRDLSVGASILVLLLTSSEDRLATLARRRPTFLADVNDVQERRGHGNEPVPMSKAEAEKLRQTAVTTLVALLDLTNED